MVLDITNLIEKQKILFLFLIIFISCIGVLVLEGDYDFDSVLIMLEITFGVFIIVCLPIYLLFVRGSKFSISESGVSFGRAYTGPFDEKPKKSNSLVQFAGKPRLFIPWEEIDEISIYLLHFQTANFLIKTKKGKWYGCAIWWHKAIDAMTALRNYGKEHLLKESDLMQAKK